MRAIVERAQHGSFHPAGSAPARPETEDYVPAAIIGQGDCPAVQRRQRKFRCGFAGEGRARIVSVQPELQCLSLPRDPDRENRQSRDGQGRGRRRTRTHAISSHTRGTDHRLLWSVKPHGVRLLTDDLRAIVCPTYPAHFSTVSAFSAPSGLSSCLNIKYRSRPVASTSFDRAAIASTSSGVYSGLRRR